MKGGGGRVGGERGSGGLGMGISGFCTWVCGRECLMCGRLFVYDSMFGGVGSRYDLQCHHQQTCEGYGTSTDLSLRNDAIIAA